MILPGSTTAKIKDYIRATWGGVYPDALLVQMVTAYKLAIAANHPPYSMATTLDQNQRRNTKMCWVMGLPATPANSALALRVAVAMYRLYLAGKVPASEYSYKIAAEIARKTAAAKEAQKSANPGFRNPLDSLAQLPGGIADAAQKSTKNIALIAVAVVAGILLIEGRPAVEAGANLAKRKIENA
jgi:hypothetical protein